MGDNKIFLSDYEIWEHFKSTISIDDLSLIASAPPYEHEAHLNALREIIDTGVICGHLQWEPVEALVSFGKDRGILRLFCSFLLLCNLRGDIDCFDIRYYPPSQIRFCIIYVCELGVAWQSQLMKFFENLAGHLESAHESFHDHIADLYIGAYLVNGLLESQERDDFLVKALEFKNLDPSNKNVSLYDFFFRIARDEARKFCDRVPRLIQDLEQC